MGGCLAWCWCVALREEKVMSGNIDQDIYAAALMYETFNAKEPKRITQYKVDMPDIVAPCGKADYITYRSRKWKSGNKTDDYIHHFDTHPNVYTDDGDAGRPVKTASLLKWNEFQMAAAVMGTCLELCVDDMLYPLTGNPLLLCRGDTRTLVILEPSGVIFIKGGKMQVQARGIVR